MGTAVRAKYQRSGIAISVTIRLGQIYSGGFMRTGTGNPGHCHVVAWNISERRMEPLQAIFG